jgi:hypothetical protein
LQPISKIFTFSSLLKAVSCGELEVTFFVGKNIGIGASDSEVSLAVGTDC